jgi:phosphoglycolate phosphatase-like HAD superfamily hydrolase
MITVVFWDIDGTLLTTQRAGVFALEDACQAITGTALDLQAIETRGVPDTEIAARILASVGWESTSKTIRDFLQLYEQQLPFRLHLRKGTVLPGVVPILSELTKRKDVVSALLTGNTRAGAMAKLKHYGLAEYFVLGAYADGLRERKLIAQSALELVEASLGRIAPERRFVVGDTPYDVDSGHTIDARTIAVATGGYTYEELTRCKPWLAMKTLPTPQEFLRILSVKNNG